MIPAVALTIAPSARAAIDRLLAGAGAGAVPTLVVGYTYDGNVKRPAVDVGYFPAALARQTATEYAAHGDALLHDCDGIVFAFVISDVSHWLEGRTLVYVDGAYLLQAN